MLRALACLAALAGCTVEARTVPGSDPPPTPGQAARTASLRTDLRATLERIESWGQDPMARLQARKVLESLGEEDLYARFPGFVLGRRELSFFCAWNGPSRPGSEIPRALDFDDPEHPLHVIDRFADAIHAQGVEFLVVPIPRRIQIYPDRLPGFPEQDADFPGAGAATTQLLEALAGRGVESIDLLPLFARERHAAPEDDDEFVFHAFNAHWTPRGARIAADAVARYARAIEGFPAPLAQQGVDFVVRRERVDYQLPPHVPETEEPVPVWVDRVLDLAGAPIDCRDRESPILLLGDSHCHWYGQDLGADFASQLYARLGVPIDQIVLNDGGAEAVWANLARRKEPLVGKRLVVWVFAANVLVDERLQYVELAGS